MLKELKHNKMVVLKLKDGSSHNLKHTASVVDIRISQQEAGFVLLDRVDSDGDVTKTRYMVNSIMYWS